MSDLYLVLHKVRGEPAFDVAIQVDLEPVSSEEMWIIPTSGHRAYPYWWDELKICVRDYEEIINFVIPPTLPDHYAANAAPKPKPSPRPATADDFLV